MTDGMQQLPTSILIQAVLYLLFSLSLFLTHMLQLLLVELQLSCLELCLLLLHKQQTYCSASQALIVCSALAHVSVYHLESRFLPIQLVVHLTLLFSDISCC